MTAERGYRTLAAAGMAITTAILGITCLLTGASAATARTSGGVTYVSASYQLNKPDERRRLTVSCPGRMNPLGGGMMTPAPASDGAGVYPHSYERLGVQHGWHSTAVLFAPHGSAPLSVTMQVACTRVHRHVTPPHRTVYLRPGQTKTVVVTCPGRRFLFAGGYQRTDFVSGGGDYVTESRAISPKSWSVTGHAFGGFGGKLTAIAYCWHGHEPLIQEVSGSASVGPGGFGAAITPPCPPGRYLAFGGFSTTPAGSSFITNGYFKTDGTWTASAQNQFGPAATVTAYGYCLKV